MVSALSLRNRQENADVASRFCFIYEWSKDSVSGGLTCREVVESETSLFDGRSAGRLGNGDTATTERWADRTAYRRESPTSLAETRASQVAPYSTARLAARARDLSDGGWGRSAHLADRLGHRSPSFKMKTYVHEVSKSHKRAAVIANDLLMKAEDQQVVEP